MSLGADDSLMDENHCFNASEWVRHPPAGFSPTNESQAIPSKAYWSIFRVWLSRLMVELGLPCLLQLEDDEVMENTEDSSSFLEHKHE